MTDCDCRTENELAISEDFVQSPTHKAASTTSIDFNGLLQPGLVLHEDLAEGNGGQAWPAGVILAKYLLRRKRDELRECSILELGAGSGLVGLAVAKGCRPSNAVHITDQEPMLALMQRNIVLNNLEHKVTASIYSWGQPSVPAHPDVLLAADCAYFEPAFPLLERALEDVIGPRTTCYFSFKKRRRADLLFMKAMKKKFNVAVIEDGPDREAYSRENICLYSISRKADRAGS